MTTSSESERLALKVWYLVHRTSDMLRRCEDEIFAKYGLTTEHFAVLAVMKYLGEPVRPTDLARALERSTNSVSMLVDRMVKAGLVKRVRDRGDRRVVNVIMTSKAESAIKPALKAGWDFIREILSPLPYEDRREFIRLSEQIKYKAVRYLDPKADIEELKKNDVTNRPDILERLVQFISESAQGIERQSGQKRKTKR